MKTSGSTGYTPPGPSGDFIPASEKGAANGVASLGVAGQLRNAQVATKANRSSRPINGVSIPAFRSVSLAAASGLAVHSSGIGVCAAADNVSGSGYISLPTAIDPTQPFRVAVLLEIGDARNMTMQIANDAQNFWSGLRITAANTAGGFSGDVGAAAVLNQTGNVGGSGVPAGTQMWVSLVGDGERVSVSFIFPGQTGATAPVFQTALARIMVAETATWKNPITTQYSGGFRIWGSAAQPENYLTRIYFTSLSTQSRLISVFASVGSIDGPTTAGFSPPGVWFPSVLQDEGSPWVLIPGSYGRDEPDLMFVHHPNGNPGNIFNQPFAKPTEFALWDAGYVVCNLTGADDSGAQFSGATSSNWGAPAGLVYRRAMEDRVRALLPSTRLLFHLGYSMGGLNALAYELTYPGRSAGFATIAGAVNLTDSYSNRGFSATVQAAYGAWYVCIQAGTGQAPGSSPTYWTRINRDKGAPALSWYASPYVWRDAYNAGTAYSVNDIVFVANAGAVSTYQDRDPVRRADAFTGLPIYMRHGAADTLIPPAQMTTFAAAASAAGATVTTVSVPGGTHLSADNWDAAAVVAFFAAIRPN
jgi:pimeloyl-ACP methyl ester carboxylesterase